MNFQIKINEKLDYSVNGKPLDWDLEILSDGRYHILFQGKSFEAEVLELNQAEKKVRLKINGKIYDLEAKDELDMLLDKLGMSQANSSKVNEIKAPMPGLVIDINVAPGDSIEKGQGVLVLEAMKMENVLKSPGSGVVKSIEVKKGEAVEKGQVLLRLS